MATVLFAAVIFAFALPGPLVVSALEPDKVIDRFIESCRKNEKLSDQQRNTALELVEKLRKDEFVRSIAVTEALREIYPTFKEALTNLGEERLEEAARQLTELTTSKDPYLAADASFYLARLHILQERYESALPLLKHVIGPGADNNLHNDDALFLAGISQINLLENKEAIQSLTSYIEKYPNAPERMRVAAWQRLELLKQIEPESLSDVFQRMEYSRRRLSLQDSGKQTQEEQQKIINMLAKLIEKAEERECKECQGDGEGQPKSGGKPRQGKGKGKGQSGGGNKQAQADVKRRVHRRGPQSPWSTLRDRERDPAFSAIKSKFPARYQQLIEQYYKSFQDERE